MNVKVRLKSASQPIEHETAGGYEKGSFYCVPVGTTTVKYPIGDIFSVVEDYGYHAPRAALEEDA